MAKSKNEFYLRRLHSLLGIIPIGAFLIVHLMINHQATQGAEAFNKAAGFMESLPFLLVTELILIYIPILYHGLYGIHIAFTAKENIGHYSLFRNCMFALQRLTGIIAFVFIFVHLWQTRLQKLFFGSESEYNKVVKHIADLHSMQDAVVYIEQEVKPTYNYWKGKEEYEQRFLDLVLKRFEV